jgi:hypothetical protein
MHAAREQRQPHLLHGCQVANRAIRDDCDATTGHETRRQHIAQDPSGQLTARVNHQHLPRIDRLEGAAMQRRRRGLRPHDVFTCWQAAHRKCSPHKALHRRPR